MSKKMSVKSMVEISKMYDVSPVKITIPLGEDSVEITVKKILSFKEACDYVNRCVFSCFHDQEYFPHLRGFATLKNLLLSYTDCKLPSDEEEQYKLLFSLSSDFYSKIYEVIDKAQFKSLQNSVDEAIQFEKDKLVRTNPLFSSLDKMITTFSESIDANTIQKLTEMADKIKSVPQSDVVKVLLDKDN